MWNKAGYLQLVHGTR